MGLAGTSDTIIAAPDGLTVQVIREPGDAWQRREDEILRSGAHLALPHRAAWLDPSRTERSWFFAIRASEEACGGIAAQVARSRALPGHLLLRVQRFGESLTPPQARAAAAALVNLARADARILRISVEVFCKDALRRNETERTLAAAGFCRSPEPRRYTHTVAVDLTAGEEEIFASFQSSARRNIRSLKKFPLEIRSVDGDLLPRMRQLHAETMSRTGGPGEYQGWERLLRLSAQHPQLCRLVGLFRTDMPGPGALLAVASAYTHGGYGQDEMAASTRQTDLKAPLRYALAWDLIRWSKMNGAEWFDFGGVTPGTLGDKDDPLGGISDFKRFFSDNVIEVGGEWVLEPRPLRARVAHMVSAAAARISGQRTAN